MAGRLAGKVAIITGASRGLGQYCAVGYGREGAKVVVAARTEVESDPRLPGTIHDTVRMVEAAGGEGLAVVCNVGDEASVEAMAEKVLGRWGRIDIVMTNAAVQPAGFISTIKPKSWSSISTCMGRSAASARRCPPCRRKRAETSSTSLRSARAAARTTARPSGRWRR